MSTSVATLITMAAATVALAAAGPAWAQEGSPTPGGKTLTALVGPVTPVVEAPRRAAVNETLRRAQQIMAKFTLPVGPADGMDGPQTRQGLCSFRRLAGLSITRYSLDTATYRKLVEFDAKYARLDDIPGGTFNGTRTYVHVHQKCQTMFYVEDGSWAKVLRVSTGTDGHKTPGGKYTLGNTNRGWYCSTLYPESCRKQTTGRFVSVSNFGNMYNPRQVVGAIFVHGSTSVPTTPASHGCIRVTVSDSDWMYDHIDRMPIFVTGSYAS